MNTLATCFEQARKFTAKHNVLRHVCIKNNTLVATDGWRLLALDLQGVTIPDCMVDVGSLKKIKTVNCNSTDISVSDSKNTVYSVYSASELKNYPEYNKVIPSDRGYTYIIEPSLAYRLLDDLRQLDSQTMIRISPDGKLDVYYEKTVSKYSSVHHKLCTLEVKLSGYHTHHSISFRTQYLIEALDTLKGTEIEMSVHGQTKPCLFKAPMHMGWGRFLLMPLGGLS